MKYEVIIFEDCNGLGKIEHYLKNNKINKFKIRRNENNYGCKGIEFLGYEVRFVSDDETLIDDVNKSFDVVFVTALHPNLKRFYVMRWYRRRFHPAPPKQIFPDVPF